MTAGIFIRTITLQHRSVEDYDEVGEPVSEQLGWVAGLSHQRNSTVAQTAPRYLWRTYSYYPWASGCGLDIYEDRPQYFTASRGPYPGG